MYSFKLGLHVTQIVEHDPTMIQLILKKYITQNVYIE